MKTHIKKILFTILAISLFQISFSQTNFKPGYAISLKGDTIRGFIDYRNWERNPDKIIFKSNINDNQTQYSPVDIREFGVLDEVYVSAIVKTDGSFNELKISSFNTEITNRVDTAFLQSMVKGKKGLYHYINKFGENNFI